MKSFAVIGCGRFGSSLAKTLFELENEVLAIDKNPNTIQEISEYVSQAVEADATQELALKELNIDRFDVVIISIGSDMEASIVATLIAKELGAKNIISQAQSELHGRLLKKIGADKVIFPEMDMGIRVAHNLTSSNILDYIQLSPDFSVLEIAVLESWHQKSLAELRIRNKYGINVIAVKRGAEIIASPSPDFVLNNYDIIVIIGSSEDVKKIELRAGE
ncbi:MAG: TrkA family potassium uptake protein [Tissierellaceae bacterium]